MSTEALGSAISGLRVAQKAIDVTAGNISNANTDGYTRKILPQTTIVADGVGMGVRYGEVQRYVDQAVMRDYRTQLGVESYYATRQSFLSRVVSAHGATDQEMNVGARLGQLHDQFVQLSANPDSRTAQSLVVDAAHRMAVSLNTAANNLLDIRNDVQENIKSEVSKLNDSLAQIASLNKQISGLLGVGRSTAALEDQRDLLVREVSKQLDVSYFIDGEGTLVLQTKRGVVLADNDARIVETDPSRLTMAMTYPQSIGGLIVKGSGIAGDADITQAPPGGRLGALISMRDEELPTYMAQLDELAYKMMVRFEDQGLRLFTDTGGVVPVNDPSVYSGISSLIRVNDQIVQDPSLIQRGTTGAVVNPGSNETIMRIVEYTFGRYKDASGTPNEPFVSYNQGYSRNISFSLVGDPNATLGDFAASMLDRQAEDLNLTNSTLEVEGQYTREVEKRLLDGSSVNTDEEMANLIVYQRTYSASAKMISALDQLFRDLLGAI